MAGGLQLPLPLLQPTCHPQITKWILILFLHYIISRDYLRVGSPVSSDPRQSSSFSPSMSSSPLILFLHQLSPEPIFQFYICNTKDFLGTLFSLEGFGIKFTCTSSVIDLTFSLVGCMVRDRASPSGWLVPEDWTSFLSC
jgi:hypothetical protein